MSENKKEEIKKNEAIQVLEKGLPNIVQEAKAIKIKNQLDLEFAGTLAAKVSNRIKVAKNETELMRLPAYKTYKAIQTFQKKLTGGYEEALAIIKQTMRSYVVETQRKEREAQLKAEMIASQKAEKERLELEAKAKEEVKKENVEKAEFYRGRAERVVEEVKVIKKVDTKFSVGGVNISYTKSLTVEITDFEKFVRSIVKMLDHSMPTNLLYCLKPEEAKIKKWVSDRDNTEDINDIPAFIRKEMGLKVTRTAKDTMRKA